MQQRSAEKRKASEEESLCLLAQRAGEERGGVPSSAAPLAKSGAMKSALAGYDGGSESGSGSGSGSDSDSEGGGDEEDEEAAKIRDEMRREKRQQREHEMRMSNMGQEQRAKHFAREQNRDISEKIALGLPKPTVSKESMLDSRLFNRESMSGSFADEESYNLYDKPLFHGSSAAAAIYKSRGNMGEGNDELYGGGTDQGVTQALSSDRFGLGPAKLGKGLGYEEGPVQFEKDVSLNPADNMFGVGQFLDEAERGVKCGLDTSM